MADHHVEANMRTWDERVPDHVLAYRAEAFADDPDAVWATTEAALLAPFVPGGSFAGLDVAHLQCHIGLDTLSFARRGAHVVGTDLSGAAIEAARALAARAGVSTASFVQCSNDDAPDVLGREFDVVFTSVGVLAWLGDLDAWARTVARLLRPGGVFLVYDAHPVLNAMDYQRDDGLLVVAEPYFATGEPQRFDDSLTYATDAPAESTVTYQWPHDLGEVLGAVLGAGLRVEAFAEHRSIPWRALPGLVPTADGAFALPEDGPQIPLMFSVVARRPADG